MLRKETFNVIDDFKINFFGYFLKLEYSLSFKLRTQSRYIKIINK